MNEQTETETKIRESIDIETARAIMGQDFFDTKPVFKEINSRCGKPIIKEPYIVSELPISEKELKKYQRDKFFIIPGYSLSIDDFFYMFLADLTICLDDSCRDLSFTRDEKVDHKCLYLVRKEIFPKSSGGSYPRWEKGLVGRKEEIPRACELFYAMLVYFLFTAKQDEKTGHRRGIRLFRRRYPACRDKVYQGFHPYIGFFPPGDELGVRYHATYNIDPCIGFAPIRKLYVP